VFPAAGCMYLGRDNARRPNLGYCGITSCIMNKQVSPLRLFLLHPWVNRVQILSHSCPRTPEHGTWKFLQVPCQPDEENCPPWTGREMSTTPVLRKDEET
jgi:hypothetical protein